MTQKAPTDMGFRELGRFITSMERSGAEVNELRVEGNKPNEEDSQRILQSIREARKKADLVMGAMLFKQALSIRMEHKPSSSGSFANQLRESLESPESREASLIFINL